jgi:hypothetical protein
LKVQTRFISVLLAIGLCATATARSKTPASPAVVDGNYVSALAAANRFLHAWQNQDVETGLLMLSDRSRQQTQEDKLESFFISTPHSEQAYEIRPGRKLGDLRYSFPVTLLTTQQGHRWNRPHVSQIEITRTGENDWTVDKLP